MEIIISDSSTLILLTKSKLIYLTMDFFDLIIPSVVYSEVIKGKESNHADAFEIERLVEERRIHVKNPKDQKLIVNLRLNYKIDEGELFAIALAKELGKGIFIDDKKGIMICKLLNIETYTALRLLNEFYLTGKVTKTELSKAITILENVGRYSTDELITVKKLLE